MSGLGRREFVALLGAAAAGMAGRGAGATGGRAGDRLSQRGIFWALRGTAGGIPSGSGRIRPRFSPAPTR
jgi:hypothetical protein